MDELNRSAEDGKADIPSGNDDITRSASIDDYVEDVEEDASSDFDPEESVISGDTVLRSQDAVWFSSSGSIIDSPFGTQQALDVTHSMPDGGTTAVVPRSRYKYLAPVQGADREWVFKHTLSLCLIFSVSVILVGLPAAFFMNYLRAFGRLLYDGIFGGNGQPAAVGEFMTHINNCVLYTLSFLIPSYFFARSLKKQGETGLMRFAPPGVALIAGSYCVLSVLNMAGAYVSDAYNGIISGFGLELPVFFDFPSVNPAMIVLYVIEIAALPAIFEEIAFRGLVMGSLRKYGDAFALIVSSLLFAAVHGTVEQIPGAFLAGLLIGYAVMSNGSLWAGIALHFLNNLTAVAFMFMGRILPGELYIYVDSLYTIVVVLFAVLAALIWVSVGEAARASVDKSPGVTVAKPYRRFFTLPAFSAFITVLLGLMAMTYVLPLVTDLLA